MENMNGVFRDTDLLSSVTTFFYKTKSEAEPGQLFCEDNDRLTLFQDSHAFGFSYNTSIPRGNEILIVGGRVRYNPDTKQLSADSQSYVIKVIESENEKVPKNMSESWNGTGLIPDSEIANVCARFNLSEADLLSYNRYFVDKILTDYFACNEGLSSYSYNEWGEFTYLAPGLFGE